MGIMYPRLHGLLSTSSSDLTEDLLHLYEFENNGNIGEDTAGSVDLTNVNGVIQVPGIVNFASEGDRDSSQYLTRPYADLSLDVNASNYTVAFWFNFLNAHPVSGNDTIFTIRDNTSDLTSDGLFYWYIPSGGTARLEWRDRGVGLYRIQTTNFFTSFPYGSWNHFVIVREGTQGRLYANGNDITVVAPQLPDIPTMTVRATDDFRIFRGGSRYQDARYDQFAMWNRTLSNAEITSLYNGGSGRLIL